MAEHPDWGRYGARPPDKFEKVGDPTRWGATDRSPIGLNVFPIVSSNQVISVTTRDPYARSWAALGTLTLPVAVWTTAQTISSILCVMGVGQIQLMQEIALWIGAGSAGGPGGLIYQQDSINGGPYINPDPFLAPNDAGAVISWQQKSFSIIGGFVGHTIGIRGKYGVIVGAMPELPAKAELSMIVTPFAAGEGL